MFPDLYTNALLNQPLLKRQARGLHFSGGTVKLNGKEYVGMIIPLQSVSFFLFAPVAEKKTTDQTLTPRVIEMLNMAAHGYPYRAIASALHISEGTVKKKLSNAYRKCFLSSRVELMPQMAEHGLPNHSSSPAQSQQS